MVVEFGVEMKCKVQATDDTTLEISGYRLSFLRLILVYTSFILTGGILRLVFHWRPDWYLKSTHVRCSLADCDTVLVRDDLKQMSVRKVLLKSADGEVVPASLGSTSFARQSCHTVLLSDEAKPVIRYFTHKKLWFIWDKVEEVFYRLKGLDHSISCTKLHEYHGLTIAEQGKLRNLYGPNKILVRITPLIELLVKEILTPFYIFQVFSVILWFVDNYRVYATAILLMSALSLCAAMYETRKMQKALHATVGNPKQLYVCRGKDVYQQIDSTDLVPGDVIEISASESVMHCDAVLIEGSCVVNESMLTGESVPVTKTPLPNPQHSQNEPDHPFHVKQHSRHILFCGTHVLQTRYYGSQKVRAVVIRTGFLTAKGDLVRSILYPHPVDFKFERDTYKFIGLLVCLAAIGMVYTFVLMTRAGNSASHMIKRALDLITIVVPPALPAALTIGIVFAQSRLKKMLIYCISPRRINVCGSINVICFDKTGTLTEDGLDMWGVMIAEAGLFSSVIKDPSMLAQGRVIETMTTCHSLTFIDNELKGDPLDLIMFKSTEWILEEARLEDSSNFDLATVVHPPQTALSESMQYQVGIVRQFPFTSTLQRMSVIGRVLMEDHFNLYLKGSPELVASLSIPESVPFDFHDQLMQHTKVGCRVIAIAWKPLPNLSFVKAQKAMRSDLERDLIFLGLLVLENRLKVETGPVIEILQRANIRCVMVTGDNILTALSVARDCCLVGSQDHVIMVNAHPPAQGQYASIEFSYADEKNEQVWEVSQLKDHSIYIDDTNQHFHFAICGKSWNIVRTYYPDLLPRLAVRGAVFARMSPEQKQQLVEVLQSLEYYVCMCGDGANDCGALKTAHAGISLSDAEASVAAPFTSRVQNITCVPCIISEGRCGLVTSFGIFKYMAIYSMLQFTSVLILYYIGTNLSDFEFLYVDLFIIATLSISFGYTCANVKLVPEAPAVSLVSLAPIASLLTHVAVNIAFQSAGLIYIRSQPWFSRGKYVKSPDPHEENFYSYENYAVFSVSMFQYILMAVVFSKGKPHRRPMFTNLFFCANLLLLTAFCVFLMLYPTKFLVNIFNLKVPDEIEFRIMLLGFAAANFLACLILESVLIDVFCKREVLSVVADESCVPGHRKAGYQQVEQEIQDCNGAWPPITESRVDSAIQGQSMEASVAYGVSDAKQDIIGNDATVHSVPVLGQCSEACS